MFRGVDEGAELLEDGMTLAWGGRTSEGEVLEEATDLEDDECGSDIVLVAPTDD